MPRAAQCRPIGDVLREVEDLRIGGILVGVAAGALASMIGTQTPIRAFHSHLDTCRQCRHNPHNLCSVGAARLQRAAVGAADLATGNLRL